MQKHPKYLGNLTNLLLNYVSQYFTIIFNASHWTQLNIMVYLEVNIQSNPAICMFIGQIVVDAGTIIFYIAHDTYPSGSYYKVKVEASPGKPALIYVGYDEDGLVFCSYTALNTTREDSEVEIDTEKGGT